MRYRTKPVEVEAVKVDDVLAIHERGSNDDWDTLPDWIREPAEMADGSVVIGAAVIRINMPGSRLGVRQAESGQWLVHQGGEIVVFKSTVFESLYEPVPHRTQAVEVLSDKQQTHEVVPPFESIPALSDKPET